MKGYALDLPAKNEMNLDILSSFADKVKITRGILNKKIPLSIYFKGYIEI